MLKIKTKEPSLCVVYYLLPLHFGLKNTPKVYKGLFATESVFPSENGFK
jgi:hypothetical protein